MSIDSVARTIAIITGVAAIFGVLAFFGLNIPFQKYFQKPIPPKIKIKSVSPESADNFISPIYKKLIFNVSNVKGVLKYPPQNPFGLDTELIIVKSSSFAPGIDSAKLNLTMDWYFPEDQFRFWERKKFVFEHPTIETENDKLANLEDSRINFFTNIKDDVVSEVLLLIRA